MKNARLQTAETSALSKRNHKRNPRLSRALVALIQGGIFREQLDSFAGASNSPEIVRRLRKMGVQVICDRVLKIDRDGKFCRCGFYRLDDLSRQQAIRLLEVMNNGER
jgi:hypothetical protein